jgi:hypothetical protein
MTSETPPLLPRQTYREGQLLGVDAFDREQALHIGLREYQTRQLFTPGILAGLEVAAALAEPPTVGWVLTVTPGAAFDSSGRIILLVDKLRFDERDVAVVEGKATIAIGDPRYFPPGAPRTWRVAIASGEGEGADRKVPQPVISLLAQEPGPDQVALARITVSATAATPPAITVTQGDAGARATLDPSRLPVIDAAGLGGSVPAEKVAGVDAARIVGLIAPGQLQPLPGDKIAGWSALVARVEALEARFPALPDTAPARRPLKGCLLGGATFIGTRLDLAMLTNTGLTFQALVRPARLQGELPLMSAVFPMIDSPEVAAAVLPETPASLAVSLLDGRPHLRFVTQGDGGPAIRSLTGRHTLLPGLWALITMTLAEDGAAALYFDGVETATLPAGGAAVLGELLLLATEGRQLFRGEAAWFALWSGARSARQVAATPDRFLTLREVTTTWRNEGLAGYWPLARGQKDDVPNLADSAAGGRLAPSWQMPSAWTDGEPEGG